MLPLVTNCLLTHGVMPHHPLPLVSSNFSLLPLDDDGDGEQVGYEGSQGLGGALYEGRERLVSMAVGALHI